jgi:hypothetical protein
MNAGPQGRSLARIAMAFVLATGAGACQHRPTITYPALPVVSDREQALDCDGIEDEILKADAIRWVMRQDGARLLSRWDLGGRAAVNVAAMIAGAFGAPVPLPTLSDEGSIALDRADQRIVALLALKSRKGCAASHTAIEGTTDAEMLVRLDEVLARERAATNTSEASTSLAERTQLLDSLRRPAAPADRPNVVRD